MPSELKSRWPQIGQATQAAVRTGTRKAAEKMASLMIGELYKPKSGRVYGGHVASAPGQTPASDSGETEESIRVQAEGDSSFAVVVGGAIAYTEFGTDKMAPRPLLTPIAEQMGGEKGEAVQIISGELRAVLR